MNPKSEKRCQNLKKREFDVTTHIYIIEVQNSASKRGIYAQINGTLFYRDQ